MRKLASKGSVMIKVQEILTHFDELRTAEAPKRFSVESLEYYERLDRLFLELFSTIHPIIDNLRDEFLVRIQAVLRRMIADLIKL